MQICWGIERSEQLGLPCETRLAHVFDANGLRWKSIIFCDTDTGEIEYMVKDKDGRTSFNPETGDIVTETIKTAAPLLVVWL